MQFPRSGQTNLITADLIQSDEPLTTGSAAFYLRALSGAETGHWWDGEDWAETETAAGTGTHIARGHWECEIAAAAWTAGTRYQCYAVHETDTQINYADEILCLTAGGLWPEPEGDWPISLAELKAHLRIDVDETEEDALLAGYLAAATRWAEEYNGRRFLLQTCIDTLDVFPCVIRPSGCPLNTVLTITYLDSAGAEQTLDPSAYLVDVSSEPGRVVPAIDSSWPETQNVPGAIVVTYLAGYGTTGADVPPMKKTAIAMLAAALYFQREDVGPDLNHVPFGARALLGTDRIIPI
jgi:uncharacterized phiE125 gp8 family phage protein